MSVNNPILYIATYDDAEAAMEDYKGLKHIDDLPILGAVVMSRGEDGKVKVHEGGAPEAEAVGVLGAGAGLVVGLFAPPLLLSMVVGAGLGAISGELVQRHEEKKLGEQLEDAIPVGSSAVVAVLEDAYLDRIEKALSKATKKVDKAVDKGDYDKIVKAIEQGGDHVEKAVES